VRALRVSVLDLTRHPLQSLIELSEMQQELNKVVAEYQKQHGKRDNLYFATVDIVDVQDLIEQLRVGALQLYCVD
jgi:hypothetical protein